MQLTKDEIDALVDWLDSNCHFDVPSPNDKTWEVRADALEKLAAAVIAAHTDKALRDVEPVAWQPRPEDADVRSGFDKGRELYGHDIRIQIASALELWALGAKGSTYADMCRIMANEVAGLYPAHTVAALAARVAELEKDALPEGVSITGYTIDMSNPMDYIRVERARQIQGPPLWAVRNARQDCLNKSGEWEWEPLPSSRDDEFLARCRFPSARAAIDAATLAAKGQA